VTEEYAPLDAALEAELRRAADLFDPVPPDLVREAAAAFEWRTLDAELAELVFDSLAERELMVVRGSAQPRLFTFQAGELTIELEVTGLLPARRLIGQLAPASSGEVEIHCAGHLASATVDELGRFAADLTGTGPFRLRWRSAGAPHVVVTDWVTA
jgi:hypothetical protein